jgi:hypothetical protein
MFSVNCKLFGYRKTNPRRCFDSNRTRTQGRELKCSLVIYYHKKVWPKQVNIFLIKLAPFFVHPKEPTGNGAPPQANKAGFVGGPKVHFGADEEHEEVAAGTSGAADGKAAQFERKNTPHPKPSVGSASGGVAAAAAAKHHKTKQQVDGHILPRMDEVCKFFKAKCFSKNLS